MPDDNVEPTEVKEEPTGLVSDVEPGGEVSPVTEKVSEEPTPITFTQEQEGEIAKRIKAAEGAVQSSKDKEWQPLKDRITELEQYAEDARLTAIEKRELDEFGDTKEVRDFQTERRKLADEQRAFGQERLANQTLAAQVNEQAKGVHARNLATEWGVDEKELLKANTPGEMESLAIRLQNVNLQAKLKDKPPEKLDSSTVSSAGVNWRELSPDDKVRRGLSQK